MNMKKKYKKLTHTINTLPLHHWIIVHIAIITRRLQLHPNTIANRETEDTQRPENVFHSSPTHHWISRSALCDMVFLLSLSLIPVHSAKVQFLGCTGFRRPKTRRIIFREMADQMEWNRIFKIYERILEIQFSIGPHNFQLFKINISELESVIIQLWMNCRSQRRHFCFIFASILIRSNSFSRLQYIEPPISQNSQNFRYFNSPFFGSQRNWFVVSNHHFGSLFFWIAISPTWFAFSARFL